MRLMRPPSCAAASSCCQAERSTGFHFRRGGSTITQQTVKNVLDRREHSFKRKFKEGVRALQLERLYTKREILEFYLNQFHVTANGNGIAIAAQYYFSKEVNCHQDESDTNVTFLYK